MDREVNADAMRVGRRAMQTVSPMRMVNARLPVRSRSMARRRYASDQSICTRPLIVERIVYWQPSEASAREECPKHHHRVPQSSRKEVCIRFLHLILG